MKPETIQLLKNLGIGLGILSGVAVLLWGAWHVVRLPMFTISEVVVTGGETISHEVIRGEVEQLLTGSYFNFIPRRFAYAYPQTEIIEQLSATPRVKEPQLSRDGTIMQVELAEFEPIALWCDYNQATASACIFLDENGYGFAQAPILAGGAYTRFVLVGQPAVTGNVYADSTDFADLRALEGLLAAYGWSVTRIELDQARDAFVFLVGDSELKITLRLTPTETLANMEAVLAAEQYQHLEPGAFAYIDLRFGNKVFVSEFGAPVEEVVPEDVLLEPAEDVADESGAAVATSTLATPVED